MKEEKIDKEKQKFYVVGDGKSEEVSEEIFKKEMKQEKDKEVKIETEPFTEAKERGDMEKIDFMYNLDSSKIKIINFWLKQHKIEKSLEEVIIYIHRYPSTGDTLIGVKRLKVLEYFI